MTNTINPPKKKAANIRVDKLRTFEGHPFKVLEDEDMENLIESIKTQGIISPLIVRPIENADEYEVISGHRRLHAAMRAGLSEVPALIYPLDRNEAMIAVVDSNLHRERILPSEKAYSYKMKMEAMKAQGKRTDLQRFGHDPDHRYQCVSAPVPPGGRTALRAAAGAAQQGNYRSHAGG